MIRSILESELAYTKLFSECREEGSLIRFTDGSIPDMYTHNYIWVKDSSAHLTDLLKQELIVGQTEQKSFVRVEMSFDVNFDRLGDLPVKPTVTHYDYMLIPTERYSAIPMKDNSRIEVATRAKVMADGISVDVLANVDAMGREFATRRIHRKSSIYQDAALPLQFYVCYNHELAVGKCELMIHRDIAKIEDFDILPDYQRQGFGSSVLRHLLKQAAEQQIQWAYLVTDSADTAKEMYTKCGFEKVGTKTELFFSLE